MKKFRLRDNHPVAKKVSQVFELCEKLGISFGHTHAGHMTVDDQATNEVYYLEDVDSSQPCPVIPHPVEYKLTYEK